MMINEDICEYFIENSQINTCRHISNQNYRNECKIDSCPRCDDSNTRWLETSSGLKLCYIIPTDVSKMLKEIR